MRPKFFSCGCNLLGYLLFISAEGLGAYAQPQSDVQTRQNDDFDLSSGTLLFGKLVLVPVLAAIGLKFLALLPIVLTKIALLSVMNFMSTNLNLLVSTLFGMKNFLGKHGLWPQEDNPIKHPDLQTFADFSSQPIMQPSFRYQYVTDAPGGKTESTIKPGKMIKVFNGFEPTDYKLMPKVNDRRRFIKSKDQKSITETRNTGNGKYKCYWTNEDNNIDSTVQPLKSNSNNYDNVDNNNNIKNNDKNEASQQEMLSKRIYDIADAPSANTNGFTEQLNSYTVQQLNNELIPPGEGFGADFYDYRSLLLSNSDDPIYQQTATLSNSEQQQRQQQQQKKIDETVVQELARNIQQLPFTKNKVKVNDHYLSTQQPILYLLGEVGTTTVKFKDVN